MHYHKSQPTMEVFDSEFHNTFDVPTHLIVHIPPPRLNITRLVICRNYRPGEPSSCSMGDGCKFVHVDVEASSLQPHPIHVNYAYRSLEKCSYARLPAGETLTVMAPNERPPVDEVPSERVLVTRGSLMRKEHTGPLSHCAHYYFNRMCNRGERCNFIHSITVDPTVTSDFKRAPARSTHRSTGSQQQREQHNAAPQQQPSLLSVVALPSSPSVDIVAPLTAAAIPTAACGDSDNEGSCGCGCEEEDFAHTNDFSPLRSQKCPVAIAAPVAAARGCCCATALVVRPSPAPAAAAVAAPSDRLRRYRFNPYSTQRSMVIVSPA